MSKTLFHRVAQPWICSTCRQSLPPQPIRNHLSYKTTSHLRVDEPSIGNGYLNSQTSAPPTQSSETSRDLSAALSTPNSTHHRDMETDSMLSGLSKSFDVLQKRPNNALQANAQIEEHQRRQQSLNFHTLYEFLPPGQRANEPVNAGAAGTGTGDLNFDPNLLSDNVQRSKGSMHHFHVYATKHNTHITLTNPDYAPMLSLSAGNIGFRKAGRGTYDAAYQLAAYTLKTVQEKGMMGKIQTLEVIWRGFGPGREAVGKVLLGSEGRFMRPKIKKATDATRLKFGGTRSPKPRRLG